MAQAIHSQRQAGHPGCRSRLKFERSAPVRIGHLSQVNAFVTDRCDIRSACGESAPKQVELIVDATARKR